MVEKERQFYLPSSNLLMIVGNYGSGKTEVAVNLAVALARAGKQVSVADLDIVNPYFRCREAQDLMRANDIRVVLPPGAQQHADLPIVVPEIKGMLQAEGDAYSIFDVGGDDVGATLLSSFRQAIGDRDYTLLQVINARRPFTDSVDGCLAMKAAIEQSSRLEVNGIISNTHLIDQTTADVIVEGYELAREVSERCGVPVELVTAMEEMARAPELEALDAPVFAMDRIMLPPWLITEEKKDSPLTGEEVLPAARTKPVFRP